MSGSVAESEQRQRAERLIAAARLTMALAATAALWLDPSEPERFAALTFRLVALHLAGALAIVVYVWAVSRLPRWLGAATHLLDLVMFGVVVWLTRGPSSPFFVFFVFALVAAALRWQWPGILWTGAAALATFLGGALWLIAAPGETDLELNRLIVRGVYLVVIVALLGYLGDHEKKLREQVSRLSALEERMRFARDLHDGTLQSLTGAALRLRAVPDLLGSDPPAALRTVHEVRDLLRDEQQTLRQFVARAREGEQATRPLPDQLLELVARVERGWGLRVDWATSACEELAPGLLDEVPKMVHEALVNSARHGGASRARLRISARRERLALTVSDNGRGFPFSGRHSSRELQASDRGPRSLMQRVAALGGELTVDSSRRGARLEISLPLGTAEAR